MHLYRALARLTASVLLAGALAAPALAVTGTVDTEDSYLRMRAEANTTSAILKQLAHGTQVEILSALENEGAKSQVIACPAAFHNIFRFQPVAPGVSVSPPDAAVQAVVFTVVCQFDQAPDIDFISIMFLPCPVGFLIKIFIRVRGMFPDQPDKCFLA